MKFCKQFFLVTLALVVSFNLMAQINSGTVDSSHENGFHSLTFVMESAFIPNSFSDNTNDILIVPVYGLNYDYQINRKWGVGLHTDIILQQFIVETHGRHEEVVRENPVSIAAVLFYKPHHRWKILGGYGIEIETHESFLLIRIGVEYSIKLPRTWELGLALENDFKINGYYTMLLGIGFTRKFVRQH